MLFITYHVETGRIHYSILT